MTGRVLDKYAAPSVESAEQAIMLNRLFLAVTVLIAAALRAQIGGEAERDFYSKGLPGLQAYVALVGLVQAHLALRPAHGAARRSLSIGADAAAISYGLCVGAGASAFLFPLYFWMILGNGVRLGPAYMGVSVASAALGFAATIWLTPFWRTNVALSAGLFCALIIIPAYGALLLRRIAEARAEAERANCAKTLLLANVSHELRTPLTAILGLGDLLNKSRLDGAQRQMVQTICGAGGLLLRHIEALLNVARDEIESDGRRAERVDLHAMLLSLRALLAVKADRKGVRLGLCIEASAPRFIRAEPGLLLDILQNLGGNAVKFTPAGAVAIHVAASRGMEGDTILRVEVRDTGIGIDRAAQERIFETFVQAGADIAPRYGGAGLGLAIVRRRLDARGGRIDLESESGKGAAFRFELLVEPDEDQGLVSPCCVYPPPSRFDGAASPDAPQAPGPVCVLAGEAFDSLALARRYGVAVVAREALPGQIALAQETAARLRGLSGGLAEAPRDEAIAENAPAKATGRTVLLAEDNGVNSLIFKAILESGGYRAVAVADGAAALDAMLSQAFDLVLLDLNMPKIDGIEAARLYRSALPEADRAPVLVLTADASPRRRRECEDAGIVACLVKPVAPEALLDALDKAFRDKPRATRGQMKPAEAPERVNGMAIAALEALGGEDFARAVIAEFIGESAEIAERMIAAATRGDLAAFQRQAHALQSSAGNVGAAALAGLCRSWRDLTPEALALHGDQYRDQLRDEWARTTAALKDFAPPRAAA
jgi:two-component system sensor histidine kinase RpfC